MLHLERGCEAGFIVVYAVTDPDKAHRGISAFILPGHAGLEPGPAERTMGLKGGHVFTEHRLPAAP